MQDARPRVEPLAGSTEKQQMLFDRAPFLARSPFLPENIVYVHSHYSLIIE